MAGVTDLIIVGGGAAGLACAVAGARQGLKVTVLERTERCGHKLALTGGRKGNFTHVATPREMAGRFDCEPGLVMPLLRRFPFQRIVRFFDDMGIDSRVDAEGCVWPARTNAAGIRDALLEELGRSGGAVRTRVRIAEVRPGWTITTDRRDEVRARNVCIATGGASYPQTGSTGDGIRIAAGLGLATTPWFAALASLKTRDDLGELAGISLPLVHMGLLTGRDPGDMQLRREATGHFIFAHEYASGSSVLNLCGFAARALTLGEKAVLRVDWVPQSNAQQLAAAIGKAREKQNRAKVTTVMAAWVSCRLAARLCGFAGVPEDRLMAGLSRGEAEAIVRKLKATDLAIAGIEPIERATVTGGGVGLDEVDMTTMAAKRFPGLYFAGEVLDLWAETGGYNLHFAWASGMRAAESVAGRRPQSGQTSG